MATTHTARALARTAITRPLTSALLKPTTATTAAPHTSHFHTSARRHALPSGPPPDGYRMPKPSRWDTDGVAALDKAGKYFLFAEMFRGMWVVLEQFFRPPYVLPSPTALAARAGTSSLGDRAMDTRS